MVLEARNLLWVILVLCVMLYATWHIHSSSPTAGRSGKTTTTEILARVDATKHQVFGISFTSAVTMELESLPKDAEGTEDLKRSCVLLLAPYRMHGMGSKVRAVRRHFGSLSSSILTLYSSMSGGEDWTVPLS